ncbi:MAG: hypothetical protein Q9167_001809 [Letrouitia subvulpina]
MLDNRTIFNGYGERQLKEEADDLDAHDPLHRLRAEFIIPTKQDLRRTTLAKPGLQPRRTLERINAHLSSWATKGVMGHFVDHEDSDLPPWMDMDDVAATRMAPLVGASPGEVAVMETLSANLHLMMASFYRPNDEKFKIILEGKAFPSDHYAVESQIRYHGFDPKDAMVLVEPQSSQESIMKTSHILSIIDDHASSTALILLPGIQYYTGQYFDIQRITAHAHRWGIMIGWDLAHAAGNADVKLHDWGVDFAVWCNYKYINAGPGAIAGLFVHEMHGGRDANNANGFRTRLCGWWGGDKATRFQMGKDFVPIPGAAGFQVGNPCALAVTSVIASLEIFEMTSMSEIRAKSVRMTNFLVQLLQQDISNDDSMNKERPYEIITPSNPSERGAQLSVRLRPGRLEGVLKVLEDNGVVVDERKPDVIRIAPAPLYNTFIEVWEFVQIFRSACQQVEESQAPKRNNAAAALKGQEQNGWSLVK